MSKVLLITLCLASGNYGRRVQNALGSEPHARDISDESSESLATLLLHMQPSLNAGFRAARPAASNVRTPIMRSTYDVASDCLDEGCPTDAVENLLAQLKKERQTSPEVVFIMKQLESLKQMEKPNKNEMESLVGNLLGTFSATDGSPLGFSGEATKAEWASKYFNTIPKTTVDLAEDCLEKGCPVDLTSELLEKLKAEENPGEEAAKAIKQLEELLAMEEPNKNEVDDLVQELLRAFSASDVSDGTNPLGYSGD
jgi:hypothetical protein